MRTYWKTHYVTEVDPNDIERAYTNRSGAGTQVSATTVAALRSVVGGDRWTEVRLPPA